MRRHAQWPRRRTCLAQVRAARTGRERAHLRTRRLPRAPLQQGGKRRIDCSIVANGHLLLQHLLERHAHLGHVIAASRVAQQLALDPELFPLSAIPPPPVTLGRTCTISSAPRITPHSRLLYLSLRCSSGSSTKCASGLSSTSNEYAVRSAFQPCGCCQHEGGEEVRGRVRTCGDTAAAVPKNMRNPTRAMTRGGGSATHDRGGTAHLRPCPRMTRNGPRANAPCAHLPPSARTRAPPAHAHELVHQAHANVVTHGFKRRVALLHVFQVAHQLRNHGAVRQCEELGVHLPLGQRKATPPPLPSTLSMFCHARSPSTVARAAALLPLIGAQKNAHSGWARCDSSCSPEGPWARSHPPSSSSTARTGEAVCRAPRKHPLRARP